MRGETWEGGTKGSPISLATVSTVRVAIAADGTLVTTAVTTRCGLPNGFRVPRLLRTIRRSPNPRDGHQDATASRTTDEPGTNRSLL
jgi:hypothetical protein